MVRFWRLESREKTKDCCAWLAPVGTVDVKRDSAEPRAAARSPHLDRHESDGALRIARTGRYGQRLEQEVQNRSMRQGAVV